MSISNISLNIFISFHIIFITLYKGMVPYFDKFIHVLWLKSEYAVVSLEKKGRPKILQLSIFDTQFLNPG